MYNKIMQRICFIYCIYALNTNRQYLNRQVVSDNNDNWYLNESVSGDSNTICFCHLCSM